MQVMNTSPGTITIAGIHHIPAQSVATFEDDLWAALRKRPAVVQWMKEGKLKEILPEPATKEPTAAEKKAAEKAAKEAEKKAADEAAAKKKAEDDAAAKAKVAAEKKA